MIDYDAHDWLRHLLDIKGSMLREIAARVLVCFAWSVGVAVFHHQVRDVSMPSIVHNLVGVALGLLLVFRTNASYDRFWEGRKQWGSIVNETRNLARSSKVHFQADAALHASLARWTVAFTYATMHALRGTQGCGPARLGIDPAEAEAAQRAQHTPLAIAVKMTELIAQGRQKGLVSDFVQVSLEHNVQLLVDAMGACERIHKTPLPFAYVVHLRRAMLIYCFTLPFALVEPLGYWSIIGTLFMAYTFFGIEEIGVEIEDPFGTDDNDLPLERICETIEFNVTALARSGA